MFLDKIQQNSFRNNFIPLRLFVPTSYYCAMEIVTGGLTAHCYFHDIVDAERTLSIPFKNVL